MLPIRQLLSRIRWDPEFGKATFELGYHDRVEARTIRVPLAEVTIEPGNRRAFRLTAADGEVHTIPFHRVREVYRNGVLIWQRPESRPRRQAE